MPLTAQQQTVIDWVKTGEGNALVGARAGTGKTFLLLNAMREMQGDVCYVVYAKKNAAEGKQKVADAGYRNVTVSTFHSAGWRAWMAANRGVKIEGTGAGQAGYRKFDRLVDEVGIPQHYRSFVRSAVSMAKQRGIGIATNLFNEQAWLDMVDHFALEEEIAEEVLKANTGEDPVRVGLRYACKTIRAGIEMAHEVVDFDDMLFMPLYANARMRQYDWLLVDEAQDTNPARRAMARRMLRVGGRAVFVGDDKQAIFGFTGADNDSLDIIKSDFGATHFPLTVTFRCPKAVVRLAKDFVSDYEAAPSNNEGEVTQIDDTEFYAASADLGPDDAVICRNTKPLVEIAYSLIKRGVPAHVEGKDIGRGLLKLVNRWSRVKTIPALVEKLEDHRETQTSKLMAKGKEVQAEALNDRIDTVIAIIEGLPAGATLDDLKAKVDAMFSDTPDGQRPKSVTLMTAHRSKGLEYRRVFIWGRTRFMPSKYARQDWQQEQERNLEYVAITRAMKTLVDVRVTLAA